MKDQFVTYEIAKKLKELGFNKPCFAYYYTDIKKDSVFDKLWFSNPADALNYNNGHRNERISAPLWQQAIDWLREKHNMNCNPQLHWTSHSNGTFSYFPNILSTNIKHSGEPNSADQIFEGGDKMTYEKAREAAILKALELIEK